MMKSVHDHQIFGKMYADIFLYSPLRQVCFAVLITFLLTGFFPPAVYAQPEADFQVRTIRVPVGNIYIRPAESASVVDTLKMGDSLTILGKDGEWYMGRLPDQRLGWVHESLFAEIPPEETPAIAESTPPETVKEEQEAESGKSGPGKTEKDFLFQAVVTVPSARIRENPSLNAPVAFGLPKGETVIVTSVTDRWYHIHSASGKSGWGFHTLFRQLRDEDEIVISRKAAEDTGRELPFRAVSRIDMSRIRSNPSYQADISFRLKKGEMVSVKEIQNDWYRVELDDGKSGWGHQLLFSGLPADNAARTIESVRFETGSDESEKVIIALNGFFPPDETFPLDEDIPKVVCDFHNFSIADHIDPIIPVNGKLIRKIRIGVHKGSHPKVRVVVDLDPQKKYGVEQVFFKKNNLYTLTFTPIPE